MAAARVVPSLDPFKDRLPELISALPDALVEEFALHGGPERFHESVVDAGRDPAHRFEEPGLSEPVPEHPRRVLGSAVRVNHGPGLGFASPPRHVEGVDDEFGADVVGNGPADDAAGEHIHDGSAVDLPGLRLDSSSRRNTE